MRYVSNLKFAELALFKKARQLPIVISDDVNNKFEVYKYSRPGPQLFGAEPHPAAENAANNIPEKDFARKGGRPELSFQAVPF